MTKIVALGAVAVFVTLFVGWWQVDGPSADPTPGKRPLPLTSMEFSLINQEGLDVGPGTLIGQPSLVFLASPTAQMSAPQHSRMFPTGSMSLGRKPMF